MKFLILGACGMAGHMTAAYLGAQGYDVTGLARRESFVCKTIICDAANFEQLERIIRGGAYSHVVNCIGVLNQFADRDKAGAVLLNAYLPHRLAEMTQTMSTKIIHISTDCVFSGKKGGYDELSFCDGETFYDRSKALGELNDGKNLTLRGSVVGPDVNKDGIGLLNWFMQQKGSVNGYRKAIWTGQTSLQLARSIEKAAQSDVTGLFHCLPKTSINKFELLKLFNHYLRNDELEVMPTDTFVCDKSLVSVRDDFDFAVPDYDMMIASLAEWMRSHRSWYPHYSIARAGGI